MAWLTRKFKTPLTEFAQAKGVVFGICGGYQMLGSLVEDPDGLEGPAGSSPGLDLLPVQTVLKAPKTTTLSRFEWGGSAGEGYEIHMGVTRRTGGRPLIKITSRNNITCDDYDGCINDDQSVAGTYVHGFFDTPAMLKQWLHLCGIDLQEETSHPLLSKNQAYDQLKTHFESHVDLRSFM